MVNLRRIRDREDGFAMVSVIAVGAIAMTLTVASLVGTTANLKRSLRDKQREQALQLADGAANHGINLMHSDATYSNATAAPNPVTKTWVIAQAAALSVTPSREGEWAWVVPNSSDVVFGVGYVPSRAQAAVTRVVKVDIEHVLPISDAAIIAGGDLTLTGGASVNGVGHVHSNGNLTLQGGALVTGNATASGTISVSGATVNGISGGSYPIAVIETLIPADYRDQTDYDLCPDLTIRTTAVTPCTGTIIGVGSGLGWEWKSNSWQLQDLTGTGNGFYAYQTDVDTTQVGSEAIPWEGIIVTDPLEVGGVRLNGDITVGTHSHIKALNNTAIVAGRDMQSNANSSITGNVRVQEQLRLNGNMTLVGQIVVVNSADSPGSIANDIKINGSADISYSSSAPSDTAGAASKSWSELI